MLVPLDDFGSDKITDIISKIYDSGEIPKEPSRLIFIALSKELDSKECEFRTTLSLMSYITKFIIRFLKNRASSKIRPEIGQGHCGFVQATGRKNAIFMLRMITERSIKI